jgi:hypothetical protein
VIVVTTLMSITAQWFVRMPVCSVF